MKAYKSLDAHNYIISSWVKEPSLKIVGTEAVIVVFEVRGFKSYYLKQLAVPSLLHITVLFHISACL